MISVFISNCILAACMITFVILKLEEVVNATASDLESHWIDGTKRQSV